MKLAKDKIEKKQIQYSTKPVDSIHDKPKIIGIPNPMSNPEFYNQYMAKK